MHVWPLNYGSFSPTVGSLRTQRAFVSRCVVVAPLLYSHWGYQAWNWTGGEAVHCLLEERTSDILSEAWQPSSTLLLATNGSAGAAGCSDFTCVPRIVTTSLQMSLHMQMTICSGTQILLNKPTELEKQAGHRHTSLARAIFPHTSV